MKEKKSEIKKIEKIEEKSIREEVQKSYLDYAMSVIVSRALPDVRDGLKPVQRRILYAMWQMGLRAGAKSRKSAAIVGEVLAKFHPHGDMAVYDTLVRMAQNFSLRYPLIDGQGNFGCFTKDTKIRLTDGRSLNFEELIKEQKEDKKHWAFTFNPETKKIEIAEIKKPRLTRKNEKIMEVVLDNEEKIKCTLDHQFMLRDNSYKPAKDLKPGDSLMPLYTKLYDGEEDLNLKGYEVIYQPTRNEWEFIHHLAKNKGNWNHFYGKRHTEESKRKMSEAHKGKTGFWAGKKRSKEEIEKFRISHLGKKPSMEAVLKGAKKRRGKNHYNWQGGLTPLTKRRLRCFLWRQIADEARNRDNNTCQLCGFKDDNIKLPVHHLIPFKVSKNNNDFKNLITLCPSCHMNLEHIVRRVSGKQWQNPGFREKIIKAVRARSKQCLKGKIIKRRILSYVYSPSNKYSKMTPEIYERERYNNCIPRIENALNYFDSFPEILTESQKHNHKVTKIRILPKREDVYDLTIEPWHNFPLSAGIFVHNSQDGDGAAAYRYTESRLSKIAEELLVDLEKDTVGWIPNYDGTTKEPLILPGKLPNLLINGAAGIAVGVATNIPPHNLSEVCEAAIYLTDHPKADTSELIKFVQGPDFPTGGIILGSQSLEESYNFGKGKIVIRAKTEITNEETNNPQIIITEIPYLVQKSLLLEKLAELVQEKKIQEIKNIRDLSNREGIRIIIDLKKGTSPEKALNRLFHSSPLEVSFHFNFLALIDGLQVKSLSLKNILEFYLEHRRIIVRKRTEWELKKVSERIHILKGFEIVLANLSRVIKIIKESKDKEKAKINLSKELSLSEEQSLAILDLRLWQLSRLEVQKVKDELKELKERKKVLSEILAEPKKILEIIRNELKELKDKYGRERKTKIIRNLPKELKDEDLIHDEPTIVTITKEGYIKRVSPEQFRVQERGGKGTIVVKAKEGDILSHLIFTSTVSELLFFTNRGKLFKCKTYEISEKSKTSKGDSIINFLSLSPDEKISSVLAKLPQNHFFLTGFKETTPQKFLLMVTKKGIVKRVKIEEFEKARKSGLIAINLEKDDLLVSVRPSTGEDEVFLVSRLGQGIRFKEKEMRQLSRGAKGIKGIKLNPKDEIVALEIIPKTKPAQAKIFTITENGFGKVSLLSSFRLQRRAGSGIKIHRVTEKTGQIMAMFFIDEKNLPEVVKGDLIIASHDGQLLRMAFKNVSLLGRVSQGVRLIRFKDKNDKVSSVALI